MKRPSYLTGIMDWRAFSGGEARPSGISYRLSNGKEGTIIDPVALRTFYHRIFYANQQHQTQSQEQTGRPAP
jgi:hypothetical protein